MANFVLSCESTVDMPLGEISARDIGVLFYRYSIDATEYTDDMSQTENGMATFYEKLKSGALAHTSQLNAYQYEEFFEQQLKKGDILHITFGSGMTKSVNNAFIAAEALSEKYPGRKILVVDSLCSSCGYGMLVSYAADMRDEGKSIDEVKAWLDANATKVHHQFYSTELDFYRRSGRMSGPASTIATILNICPLMRLNQEGSIVAYSKVRGTKAAIDSTVNEMLLHAQNGADYAGKCFICHSCCPDKAAKTREAVLAKFKNLADIPIYEIGAIIGSHCGPGTVAVFFMGDERPQ